MNQRNAVRYDAGLLPESLSKVAVSWAEDSPVESYVENFCSHGIRVSIPSSLVPAAVPEKNDTVKVLIPVDSSRHMWFSGTCVYTTHDRDNHVSMGIYFNNPDEQNHLHNVLYSSLHQQFGPGPFIPHEWEELVDKLCNSDDPELNRIGCREMEDIRRRSLEQ